MESSGIDRILDAEEVKAALAAHGFGVERPRGGAAVIALDEPLRVAWANAAAVALFGTADADALFAQVFAGRGRDGLTSAVRRLVPGGGAKAERLRLFRGFRTRTLTVSISRMRLDDGEDVFVLAVPPATADAEDPSVFGVSALRVPPSAPRGADKAVQPPPAAAAVPAARAAHRATFGAKRFLWHTDAQHRLVSVSGAPTDLAGLGAEPTGQDFAGLAAALAADPHAALDSALASLRPWSGLSLPWPLQDGTGVVPVSLGAAPVRGAGGVFAGYRGFGVADFAAAGPPPAVPAVQDLPGAVTEPDDPADAPAIPDHAVPAAEDGEPAFEAPDPQPPVRVASPALPPEPEAVIPSAKVVALRPLQLVGHGPGSEGALGRRREDSPPPSRPGDTDPSNLSSVEHSNFHEIGRALKGELGDGSPAGTGVPPGATDAMAGVLAGLPAGVLVVSGGRVVFANAAFLAMSRYASLDALEEAGGPDHLFGGDGLGQIAEARGERAFALTAADGQVMALDGRVGPVSWNGGAALALALHPASDRIGQVERLELDLRRKEVDALDARALLDRVTDAVAIVDGQGRVVMLNRAGETLFGLPARGAVGESLGSLLSAEAQSAALGAVLAANAEGPAAEAGTIAVSGRRPAGGLLPLAMTARALRPGRIGVVLRDESAVEGLRREAHLLRAELDHAAGLRADFLGRVSHEIRTPLNAILGFAEIILDERFGPIGNPRYKDYLADIHAAGKHVIDFVGDLLDLSKMQAGRAELSVAAVDVNRLVSETVGEMQGQAHRERVIVRQSLLPHLPGALADEAALRQILTNVLSNAITFNEPGGQAIVSTALTESDAVAIRVRDTGVGMSDTELATAMEPLRQISMGRPGSGSGLGLPLTRALVEANGATMSIHSRKDEGTLVEIVLRPAPVERSVPAA